MTDADSQRDHVLGFFSKVRYIRRSSIACGATFGDKGS
jgi:hypothetical protein